MAIPQLTWKQLKERVETEMRARGMDPETARVRYIDLHGYDQPSDILVRPSDDDDGEVEVW